MVTGQSWRQGLCCWLGQGSSGALQSRATTAFPWWGSEDHQEWENTRNNWVRDWRYPWGATFHIERTPKWHWMLMHHHSSTWLREAGQLQTVLLGLRLSSIRVTTGITPLILQPVSEDNLRELTGTTFLCEERQWAPLVCQAQKSNCALKLTCTNPHKHKCTAALLRTFPTHEGGILNRKANKQLRK